MKNLIWVLLPTLALLFIACDPDDDLGGRCEGADPAITIISVSDTEPPLTYTVTIENQGTTDFISNANQQAVYFYINGNFVDERPFPGNDLLVDASFDVSFIDTFATPDSSVLRFLIIYDPDILIDGNDENDDCDTDNNSLEIVSVEG